VAVPGDEKGFLTAKQLAVCGCFDGAPSGEELERFFSPMTRTGSSSRNVGATRAILGLLP
jgi:hypothetical protein